MAKVVYFRFYPKSALSCLRQAKKKRRGATEVVVTKIFLMITVYMLTKYSTKIKNRKLSNAPNADSLFQDHEKFGNNLEKNHQLYIQKRKRRKQRILKMALIKSPTYAKMILYRQTMKLMKK